MERQKLKQILEEIYAIDSIKSILSGRMKPSSKIRIDLNKEHKIPFSAWEDIKSYIKTIPNPQAENKVCKEKD